jgi:hypothetical protein
MGMHKRHLSIHESYVIARPSIEFGTVALHVQFNIQQTTDMEETFGLKSCIDIVFARNVDNLKCANYITYFSYHRLILSITNST